jgi:integrase
MDSARLHEHKADSASHAHNRSAPDNIEPRTPRKTLDGYTIHMEDDVWRIPNRGPLRVAEVTNRLPPQLADSLRRLLAHTVQFKAWGTAISDIKVFKTYLRLKDPLPISTATVINARDGLAQGQFMRLRILVKECFDLGYPGISQDVYPLVVDSKLPPEQSLRPVRSWDPKKGPLTEIERQDFIEAIIQAYDSAHLSLSDLALGLLLCHAGRRPAQIAALRIKDLLPRNGEHYFLSVPRTKQQGMPVGSEYKEYALSREVWIVLRAQCDDVIRRVSDRLPFAVPPDLMHELPMWPRYEWLQGIGSLDQLVAEIAAQSPRHNEDRVRTGLKRIAKSLNLMSARIGGPMPLYPYRFRYTLGVAAARAGCSEFEIAELLEHLTIENMDAYTTSVPEHAQRLQAALSADMKVYADAFLGRVVEQESDAVRGDDPHSRVTMKGSGMGTCGSYGYCGADVPIPCYTCRQFQPWVDGPHEEVLAMLLARRQTYHAITGAEDTTAALERTIVAVNEVIGVCQRIRERRRD